MNSSLVFYQYVMIYLFSYISYSYSFTSYRPINALNLISSIKLYESKQASINDNDVSNSYSSSSSSNSIVSENWKAPAHEINRRRNFAIISHPDAGKTTLTEKLLLFGGAIQGNITYHYYTTTNVIN